MGQWSVDRGRWSVVRTGSGSDWVLRFVLLKGLVCSVFSVVNSSWALPSRCRLSC